LVFPCGRIGRKLRENCKEFRISKLSRVYLAAVLEYLTAELIEIIGDTAKNDKKSRIMPKHIVRALA